jgi:hypothetical protein
MSPTVRPDPCDPGSYVSPNLALNRPVTASQEELGSNDEYTARSVNDGSIRTWWSAADGAPQWVEIDLENEQLLGRVEIPYRPRHTARATDPPGGGPGR